MASWSAAGTDPSPVSFSFDLGAGPRSPICSLLTLCSILGHGLLGERAHRLYSAVVEDRGAAQR
ncbi:MAG: hypothetical protein F6K11_18795 [Leptolyngbya sp. SIO3F4]|nr:hypothetical protein [Leptolyngbya sp. SIO3F4]